MKISNHARPVRALINLFVVCFLWLVAGAGLAEAGNYYVAKTGNDADPGTEALPWLTIAKAANTLQAGDTVYVKAGTYNERVTIKVQGSALGGYITFRNYGTDTVTLDGTGFNTSSPWGGLLQAFGMSYIRIQGFHVVNVQGGTSGGSIVISGSTGGSHIEILNNEVTAHTGGNAIGIRGSNLSYILVDNNEVHHCNTNSQEAIRVDKGVYYFTIRNNRVHDNTNIGIDCVGWGVQPAYGHIQNNVCYGNGLTLKGAHGIYVDGGMFITIEDNICYNNAGGISVGAEYTGEVAHNVIVRRNVLYNGWQKGITTGGSNSTNGRSQDCAFVHNTFYQDNQGSWTTEFKVSNFQGTLLFKNNIIYNTDLTSVYILENRTSTNPENFLSDYNCYYPSNAVFDYKNGIYKTLTAWQTATGGDVHSINQDCLFSDAANHDFHLQTASPCRDQGDFLTRTTSSGSGTVIPVADARYFCDGYSGYFPGDLVQIGTQSPVRISQVDYTRNTLTVSQPVSWAANDGVSLPFSGTRPDMGAFEYGVDMPTPIPLATATSTWTPTFTATPSASATRMWTPTFTATPTASATPTLTPTFTATPSASATGTWTPTFTPTTTAMATATSTFTPTVGKDYYVAKNGNDSNPGTEALPWLTITKAANTLQAGDTVYVKAGTYNERVTINVSGNAQDGYITFRNYGTDTVTLDGTGFNTSSPWGGLLQAFGMSYIRIQGFHVVNVQGGTSGGSIVISGSTGGSHIEILNNEVTAHTGGNAIGIRGSNLSYILVDNNEVHHCNTGSQDAIRVDMGTYYFKITNNRIHDNSNIGVRCSGWGVQPAYGLIQNNTLYGNGVNASGAHAIYIDGGIYTAILGNVCYGNRGGIAAGGEMTGEVSHHIIIRRNLLMTGIEKGMTLGASTSTGGGAADCAIAHNTFFNNNAGSWSSELKFNYFQGTNVAKNNIIYDTDVTSVYLADNRRGPVPENIAIDYNCYFPANAVYAYKSSEYKLLAAWQTATGQDSHSFASDPLFQDAANRNFSLQAGSPCKDAGDFLTKTTAAGSGTTLPVADARFFCDGYGGLFPGDVIRVGSQTPVGIIQVNYSNNTIGLNRALAWNQGDGVSLSFSGTKPDMGAYESGLVVSAASVRLSGNQKLGTTTLGTPDSSGKAKNTDPAVAFIPAITSTSTLTPTTTPTVPPAPWVETEKVTVYPNPAKGTVYFAYTLSGESEITIDIYQISGERVSRITENKNGGAGQTLISSWQTGGMAPGIYIGHVVARDSNGHKVLNQIKKISLVK